MGCAGLMRPRNTARTRPSTTASSARAAWACSTELLPSLRRACRSGSLSIAHASESHRRAASLCKKHCSPLPRPLQLKAACRHRLRRQVFDSSADTKSDERSQGRNAHASCAAAANSLTGDEGNDSDAFRKTLAERAIKPSAEKELQAPASLAARRSIKSVTKSKTASTGSKISGASLPLRLLRAARSASQQPSSSILR